MEFLSDEEIQKLDADKAYTEFTKAVRCVQLLRQQARGGSRSSIAQLKDATDYMFKVDARMNKLDSVTPERKPLFGESRAISFIRSIIKTVKR